MTPHQNHAAADGGRSISRENWDELRSGPLLGETRAAVYRALLEGGAATTEELAARTRLPLLTVRPRVTELVQAGLAAAAGRRGRCGVYAAADPGEYLRALEAEAREWDEADRQGALPLEL